jgi:Cu2+-exporting ATPase
MEVREMDAPEGTLAAAAAVERRAAHPVARALVASVDGDDPSEISAFESHGTGVSGIVDGERTLVGTPELFDERGWDIASDLRKRAETARQAGDVPALVGRGGTAEGIAVVGDTPRAGWAETVTDLAESGVEVVVLTGDRGAAAGFLSDHDAIDRVFAGVPPAGKAEAVRRLGADRRVAMVGDGTNDAMALSVADLGLSLGSGTAMAADAADVAILGDDVRSVGTAFDLARTAGRLLERNVRLSGAYNVIVIGLAVAGVLAPVFAVGAAALTGGLLAASSALAFSDR